MTKTLTLAIVVAGGALGASTRAPAATVGRAVNVHSVLISLAAFGFALLLVMNGFAGLRTWAY